MRLHTKCPPAALVVAVAVLGACETTEERDDPTGAMPVEVARAEAARLAPPGESTPPRALAPLRRRLAEHAQRPRECPSDAGGGALERARSLAEVGRFAEALQLLAPLAGLGENEPSASGVERVELLAVAARVHAWLGDPAGAAEAAERALGATPPGTGGPAVALARASAAQSAGRLEEAEARYRAALAAARDRDAPASAVDPVDTASLLADNLLAQGHAVEAEAVARDAVGLAIDAPADVGWSGPGGPATRLAAALRAQGREFDAEAIARDAIAAFERGCAPPDALERIAASRFLVRLLGARADWDALGEETRRARVALGEETGAFARLHERDPEPWLAAAAGGQGAEALRALEALAARAVEERGEQAPGTLELRGALALARWHAGERAQALDGLRAASVPHLQGRRVLGRSEVDRRTGRMWQVLERYAALLAEAASSAPDAASKSALVDEHFRVAQAIAFGKVHRHFGPDAARAAVRDPELGALVDELRSARRAVAELDAALERSVVLDRRWLPDGLLEARRDRMAALLERSGALEDAIRERFPRYAELLAPRPIGTGEAQRAMRPGEAMLTFQVTAERSYAWAIPQSGPIEYAALTLDAVTLDAWVATLREPLDPAGPVAPPESLAPYDVESAYALFEAMLAPVAPGWRSAVHLIVVPDGALRALPIGMLPTAEPRLPLAVDLPYEEYRAVEWLAHQHPISHLPLVASLVTIGHPEPLATGGSAYAGFGDPIFVPPPEEEEDEAPGEDRDEAQAAPSDAEPGPAPLALRPVLAGPVASVAELPPLPDTEREVEELARVLRSGPETVFLAARAREENVRERDLSRRQILHFATHLLPPGALDGLDVPAIALSPPQAARAGEGDGLVDIDEVLALRLDADFVVLSGSRATGEASAALDRAFMHAGTRVVLSSAWPVNPEASLELLASMPVIDEDELGRSRAEVLRLAMLQMVAEGVATDEQGRPRYALAHPLFWGPYRLVGDGRRSLR